MVAIDVPHLVLLAMLGGFCIWYLEDSRAASTDVQNLLLIEPVALFGIVMTVLQGPAISAGGAARPVLQLLLREADVLRAPEFEHPVYGVDANRDLGRSALIGARS